jgi:hypothetical protein
MRELERDSQHLAQVRRLSWTSSALSGAVNDPRREDKKAKHSP